MNVSATNLANKDTTRTAEGGPYKPREVVLNAKSMGAEPFSRVLDGMLDDSETPLGVQSEVVVSDKDPILTYDPGHPDADENGYLASPNVSPVREMVNMMGAQRAYEAGTTMLQNIRRMAETAMRIGR